jgi:tetratricopeptide (TPR) repeat protein
MRRKAHVLAGALFAGASLIASGAASAATLILGEGPALACFEAADGRRDDVEALRTCNLALDTQALTPRDRAATQINRGIIQIHRRNPRAALADFESAARLQPGMGESYVNRGAALILLGDYSGAIQSINQGIELGSADAHEAYFNRAIAHEQAGDLRAAYTDYRQALALKPDWGQAQAELQRFTVRRAN